MRNGACRLLLVPSLSMFALSVTVAIAACAAAVLSSWQHRLRMSRLEP